MIDLFDAPAAPRVDAELLAQAVAFVRSRYVSIPRLAVIIDSDFDLFAEHVQEAQVIPTTEVPGFPQSAIESRWLWGRVANKKILLVKGGVHAYKGGAATKPGFIIHLLAELGVKRLLVIVSAAALNTEIALGDLMLIDDHINLMFANPLRGQHRKEWGAQWPDLLAPYAPALQQIALQTAADLRMPLPRGVLFATAGPSLETAAEARMMRRFAEAASMTLVPEALVAVSRRMEALALAHLTRSATGLGKSARAEIANHRHAAHLPFLTALIKRIG